MGPRSDQTEGVPSAKAALLALGGAYLTAIMALASFFVQCDLLGRARAPPPTLISTVSAKAVALEPVARPVVIEPPLSVEVAKSVEDSK
jgi:hypothetical protein